MSAVLRPIQRPLTKPELLRFYDCRAAAAMHRMKAAKLDIAAAQVEIDAGEDSVASGMRAALLEFAAQQSAYLEAMREVSRLQGSAIHV